MIAVVIAGGSGTRLWPLSTPDYPKHLLKINAYDKSLVQQAYERAKDLSGDVYVITEKNHAHHLREQLSELDDNHLIIEPARRGTAGCIIAVLNYLKDKHALTEPIAFLPADHNIRDTEGFIDSFKLAAKKSRKEGKIVLVGVEPTYPATGFGYIEKGVALDDSGSAYEVSSFKEKPQYSVAKHYFESGNFLWNCGYFVASNQTFTRMMKAYAPELFSDYQKLAAAGDKYEEAYLSLDVNAIDYALIEKIPVLLVLRANFDWMDLGSFSDLHQAVGGDENGNNLSGSNINIDEVENSFIHNQEAKPLVVMGLDNVVVVNTPNGILVARKDLSQRIGEISKKIIAESEGT